CVGVPPWLKGWWASRRYGADGFDQRGCGLRPGQSRLQARRGLRRRGSGDAGPGRLLYIRCAGPSRLAGAVAMSGPKDDEERLVTSKRAEEDAAELALRPQMLIG